MFIWKQTLSSKDYPESAQFHDSINMQLRFAGKVYDAIDITEHYIEHIRDIDSLKTEWFRVNLLIANWSSNLLADHKKSEKYARLALEKAIHENDSIHLGKAYKAMARLYRNQSNFKKSQEYALKSIHILSSCNDSLALMNMYIGAGLNYIYVNLPYEAQTYFSKALEIATIIKFEGGISASHNYNSITFLLKQKYRKALATAKQGLFHSKMATGKYYMHIAHISMGAAYYYLELTDSATMHLDSAQALIDKRMWGNSLSELLKYRALIHLRKGENHKALDNILQGWKLIESGNQPIYSVLDYHYVLHQIYDRTNQPEKSLLHLRNYIELRDNLRTYEIQARTWQAEKEKASQEINTLRIKRQHEKQQLHQEQKSNRLIKTLSVFLIIITGLIVVLLINVRRKNRLLSESLKHKTLLNQEMHHRVKNNLQIISSMLFFHTQDKHESDPIVKGKMIAMRNRIKSMSIVHQKLTIKEDRFVMSSREYINDLIPEIIQSLDNDGQLGILKVDIVDLDLEIDLLTALGLIINEMITNSIKHAFNRNLEEGMIGVSLKKNDSKLVLEVYDNGPGLKVKSTNTESLGMNLIKSFAKKIDASVRFVDQDGLKLVVTINRFLSDDKIGLSQQG